MQDRYGLTLREKSQLDHIGSFGYRVYRIPRQSLPTFRHQGNWAVADPLGGSDGFYLVVNTIEQAYQEMTEGGII
jgi:hypothetical protein